MTMIQIPDFTIDVAAYATSVCWSDDRRRYHFWLQPDGTLGGFYSNRTLGKPGDSMTRQLDPDSKRWKDVIAAICDEIRDNDMIAKARADRQARLDAEKAEARAARVNHLRDAFHAVKPGLSETLTDDEILALADVRA